MYFPDNPANEFVCRHLCRTLFHLQFAAVSAEPQRPPRVPTTHAVSVRQSLPPSTHSRLPSQNASWISCQRVQPRSIRLTRRPRLNRRSTSASRAALPPLAPAHLPRAFSTLVPPSSSPSKGVSRFLLSVLFFPCFFFFFPHFSIHLQRVRSVPGRTGERGYGPDVLRELSPTALPTVSPTGGRGRVCASPLSVHPLARLCVCHVRVRLLRCTYARLSRSLAV